MAEDTPLRRREPAFNVPAVVIGCCAVLLGIHALRLLLNAETDDRLVALLAFVPARLTLALHLVPNRLAESYQATVGHNPFVAAQLDLLIGDGSPRPWTLLTYALIHGSWLHVGVNCIWLVAFGSAVARRFTALRFLLLLVVSAFAGALVQYAADITGFQLVIGASAAVSGAMGAAVRFMFRPHDEPRRLFDPSRLQDIYRQPALSLRETLATRMALVFILFWFATDILFGLFPALAGLGDVPVAWQAHIGGFLAGLLLFRLFDRRQEAEQAGLARPYSGEVAGEGLPD